MELNFSIIIIISSFSISPPWESNLVGTMSNVDQMDKKERKYKI